MFHNQLKALGAWVVCFLVLYFAHLGIILLGPTSQDWVNLLLVGVRTTLAIAIVLMLLAATFRVLGFLITVVVLFTSMRRRHQMRSVVLMVKDDFFDIFQPPWPRGIFQWWWCRIFGVRI
jgi:hypothetical protein